jgi:hypothetical protein
MKFSGYHVGVGVLVQAPEQTCVPCTHGQNAFSWYVTVVNTNMSTCWPGTNINNKAVNTQQLVYA